MSTSLKQTFQQDDGGLTFEWVVLITLIVIGIVGGLSAVRDGVIDELGDVAEATLNIDQSWSIETSPCDPFQMNFGSYTDTRANRPEGSEILVRGRVSQAP